MQILCSYQLETLIQNMTVSFLAVNKGLKSQKAIDFAHKHKFIENEMYATEV